MRTRSVPPPFFVVRITDATAAPSYQWAEVWDQGAGALVDLTGGRYGGALNPGVAVLGNAFAAGDCALCRQADGNAGLTWELYPLPNGAGRCGATTTTAGPCSGSCHWNYSASTQAWSLTTSACSAGCNCLAPTWCPPADACAGTACGRLDEHAAPPNCSGTTTGSPCPQPTGCTEGCVWYCHPVRGWVQKRNGCSAACPCPRPEGACSAGGCDTEASTPCAVVPSYCNGSCRWMWVASTSTWEWVEGTCSFQGATNCSCDPPSQPGVSSCQEASTQCYSHGAAPCGAVTTAGPGGNCNGECLWGSSSGTAWDTIVRPCAGSDCVCYPPIGTPSGTCAQAPGACVAGEPTTTTTPTPCDQGGGCLWSCVGSPPRWAKVGSGGGGDGCSSRPGSCCCVQPDAAGTSCDSATPGAMYEFGCVDGFGPDAWKCSGPTTTTTAGPSCSGTCTYVCNGASDWALSGNNCVGSPCGCDTLYTTGFGCTPGTSTSRGCCSGPSCTQGTTTTTAAPKYTCDIGFGTCFQSPSGHYTSLAACQTACGQSTTTTAAVIPTTTTAAPTTTTSTPSPCALSGYCDYVCFGLQWELFDSSCLPGCGCGFNYPGACTDGTLRSVNCSPL